ncbi:hypothetical protein FB45DRAFT_197648 [Roridomyces roridus]|uniref:Zinc-finger domain-containing protein n=1 Tax=Roridomyces roridus TaxID=1738132 RepID=A0AAD7CFQ5_9AGAR|nr:hypothetical protein FB45DRAFT_197648 [Roridomyces roridus]
MQYQYHPYVYVPAPPYALPSKENEPWRMATYYPNYTNLPPHPPLKRKLSFPEQSFQQAPVSYLTKKPKFDSAEPTPDLPTATYIYCHQCNKKRDKEDSVQCNHSESYAVAKGRPPKSRRCNSKYCKNCLKIRYNEDIDAIKATKPSHPNGEEYDFKCPRCRGICNCSRCRKAQGLDPIQKVANVAPAEQVASTSKEKPKRAPRPPKAKPTGALPTLKWTKLRTNLPVEDAEARFHIREFVLRFFAKALPKAHLDELEQISGNGRNRYDEDELVPWVSEACLKSVILAFLGVLAQEEANDKIKKAIQAGIKDIRAPAVGIAKMWQILSSLRDCLDASEPGSDTDSDESDTVPSFPDPIPLPESAIGNSRRTRSAGTGSFIVDTAQMIPVVLGMIESVVDTTVIRADIDQGIKDSKDILRDVKDATRNANDRWEKSRKEAENVKEQEFKARREAHKQLLQDLEGAGKVAMNRTNSRFSTLGSDNEGRVYYALSPGLGECDWAAEFLTLMAAEGDAEDAVRAAKSKRKRRGKREDERSSLKEWSWFVAVRGKKPPAWPPNQTNSRGRQRL